MKKLLATLMLLVCVSVAFAGKTGDSANAIPNQNAPVCHDKEGKWNPESKSCDPNACGCLFHQIEEFVIGLFE